MDMMPTKYFVPEHVRSGLRHMAATKAQMRSRTGRVTTARRLCTAAFATRAMTATWCTEQS